MKKLRLNIPNVQKMSLAEMTECCGGKGAGLSLAGNALSEGLIYVWRKIASLF